MMAIMRGHLLLFTDNLYALTSHIYQTDFVDLHYYKFGTGSRHMLCFHGFGMHGKQFLLLEQHLGCKYTFWGFDLFFHKETKLKDESLTTVKAGLTKKQLALLFEDFCKAHDINRFSVIGYSMGTHYATAIVEEIPAYIDEYIVAAPSSIEPGYLIRFFSRNRLGNKILERFVLSKTAMIKLLFACKKTRLIDERSYDILFKEIETHKLRFSLYASFTYLRFLVTDEQKLSELLNAYGIRSIFIFGKHDKAYPQTIGRKFFRNVKTVEVFNLDETHELINQRFALFLKELLL